MQLAASDVAAPVTRLVREAVAVDAQATLECGVRCWRRSSANAEPPDEELELEFELGTGAWLSGSPSPSPSPSLPPL